MTRLDLRWIGANKWKEFGMAERPDVYGGFVIGPDGNEQNVWWPPSMGTTPKSLTTTAPMADATRVFAIPGVRCAPQHQLSRMAGAV